MAAAAKLCPKRLYLMGSNPHPGAQNFIPHARVREGDSALIKEFGNAGAGLFPICAAVLEEVKQQYDVEVVGTLDQVRMQFFAITLQRKLTHPAIVAISQNAKEGLLAAAV